MIRTAIFGAGRMASCVISLAQDFEDIELLAQVSRRRPGTADEGPALPYFESLDEVPKSLCAKLDLLIDFTLPEGTREAAQWCASKNVSLLSGVTGIGEDVKLALDEAARSVAVLWAPNLSFGINLIAGLLQGLRQVLDEQVPVRIEDVHHEHKKDAPSGTALFLARQLKAPTKSAVGTDPSRIQEDFPGIEFVSRRVGEIVGDHAIAFQLEDEIISLAHHAEDRRLFARGALQAACWLSRQPAGRYSPADWISGGAGDPS